MPYFLWIKLKIWNVYRDVSVDDYFLLVESLDTEVVAFAPMLASHHPRVIAVGEGSGNLLRVNLLLSEECRLRRNIPLLKQVSEHRYVEIFISFIYETILRFSIRKP